eukprot:2159094-Prymnesium_polylepis.1
MHMRWRLASSTMLHVNPKVLGQQATSSPARALCWLAAAEQPAAVVFDERRTCRSRGWVTM